MQVYRASVHASLDNGELDLFEALAFHASTLLQAFLGIAEFLILPKVRSTLPNTIIRDTYFEYEKFKRHSMGFARFGLKVECENIIGFRRLFVFRNTFSVQIHVIGDAYNAQVARIFLPDFVALHLENTDGASFVLILKICLFDKAGNDIVDDPILRNKYIEKFLE